MLRILWLGLLSFPAFLEPPGDSISTPIRPAVEFEISIGRNSEIDLRDAIDQFAKAAGLTTPLPAPGVRLPVVGRAGTLGRNLLEQALGDGTKIQVEKDRLRITIAPATKGQREQTLRELSRQAELEAKRQAQYGLHALKSYRPNDPNRPTVCLVHGMNSSSYGFVHMIKPLEDAGFGVVVFDYRFNRELRETCDLFAKEWKAFRARKGEKRDWALVGHSMGCLVARDYVEGPKFADDVSTLIMLAPVNQGSSLAKTQTLLQWLDGVKLTGNKRTSEALAKIGDGLGEAANDITPGSPFLKELNAKPRREGVAYHILAGNRGLVSEAARAQIDAQFGQAKRKAGLLSSLTRAVIGDDLLGGLDEISDGTGDACVSVERTKLDGVDDHVTIHANHAELIRAPVLFSDPGPVPCMPQLLKWLKASEKPATAGPPVN